MEDIDTLPKDNITLFEILHETRYYRIPTLEAAVLQKMQQVQII
jgi:hypothetical protein